MRVSCLVLVVGLVLPLGACARGGAEVVGVDGKDLKPLPDNAVPAQLLGLNVRHEDVTAVLPQFRQTYFDALSMYSLRRADDRLEATMQIGRLNGDASKTQNLQAAIIDQIGGERSRKVRYGTRSVYLAEATRQQLAVWFTGDYVFVLSSRADFNQPRNLLRAALELDPGRPA